MFSVEQVERDLDQVRTTIGSERPGIDRQTEHFCALVDTLLRVSRTLDANDPRRVALLSLIDRAWQRLDLTRPGSPLFHASIAAAVALLDEGLAALDTGEMRPTVVAVAHAHLDAAGPERETCAEAVRALAAVLALMDEYPELRFVYSSPHIYQCIRETAPDLYAAIHERADAGRWEVLGGSWVEFDAHLPGGEALVRQILLGKRFTRHEFEVDPAVLWLPDAAGLSGTLPQLMVRSGIRYLVTGSLGAGGTECFPYDTFVWRGLDGSRVLVYAAATPGVQADSDPGHTFLGDLSPERVAAGWRDYRHKGVSDEIMLPFGWNNGGGGPTREMIEAARAQAHLPGHPAVRLDTALAFLDRLAARVAGKELPVWDGEVCPGSVQGGGSNHSRARWANRRAQALYHDAEWSSTLADLLGRAPYPLRALRAGWERLLRLQAQSAAADQDHAPVTTIGQQVLDTALHAVAAGVRTEQTSVILFNPLPWRREALVALPWQPELGGKTLRDEAGRPLSTQETVDEQGERQVLVEASSLPAMGYRAYPLVDAAPVEAAELSVTPRRLENAYYCLLLNDAGQIVSLWDKDAGREVLCPGARGNVLRVFALCPNGGEACHSDGSGPAAEVDGLIEACVEEAGPVRGSLRLSWRVGSSTITQRLTLYRRSRRIDFRTRLDWHEPHRGLRVVFPVDVRATFATYETQFGTVERPTHRNTPWDAALSEVPAQRWADLSEGNYGVAVLNDGKQGYSVERNLLAVTLRGPSGLAGGDDGRGWETFAYSLLPHQGTWREAGVVREAAALNHPPYALVVPASPGGALSPSHELVAVDADHVVLETIKRAEDGDGWIVRLYEAEQRRRPAVTATFGPEMRHALECNLLEEAIGPAPVVGHTLTFPMAPYEVKTFKVWLA